MDTVVVLMSTYNGEKYLVEQIDSVLKQKDVFLNMVIRDDGSTDKTIKIIKDYTERYDNVKLIIGKNLGPSQSFLTLLSIAPDADFYAFCDQDDYWKDRKLIEAIKIIKSNSVIDEPVLYYSNLVVTDSKLKPCRLALKQGNKVPGKYSSLIDNQVTGCTIVMNRSLVKIIRYKRPKECTMHDTWCNIVGSFLGKVIYDENSYIFYRQHESNVIGMSKKRKYIGNIKEHIWRLKNREMKPRLRNAQNFYYCFSNFLTVEEQKKIKKIIFYKKNMVSKLRLLFDYDIRSYSIIGDIKYRLLILMGKI